MTAAPFLTVDRVSTLDAIRVALREFEEQSLAAGKRRLALELADLIAQVEAMLDDNAAAVRGAS